MSVYSLQSRHLTNLGPYRAVEIFRKLLLNESTRVGIGRNLVDVPDCIYVGDGGLDAVIQNADPSAVDVIPQGSSGFQIKSSDLSPNECKKELHEKGDLQSPLTPEIKRLFDNKGTYILGLFAAITDTKKRNREEAIKNEIAKMGYSDPKIRVYTLNQLMSFIQRFVALVAEIKGYGSESLPYKKWAGNLDVVKPKIFVTEDQRSKILEEIRRTIRNPNNQTPIFRITGLSGLGKTRLAFEILSPNDLCNSVIYLRASNLKGSELFNALIMDDSLEGIVVVDECSLEDHEYFVNSFSRRGRRLTLITISHQMDKVAPPTLHFQLEPLSENKIKELLSAEVSGLPSDIIDRIVGFADGYPRIAMLLAENYSLGLSTPDDILTINDQTLINRLIAGKLELMSEWFRKTKRVLMGLSLFEKIGYKDEVSYEAKWVAKLVNVDWMEFQEVVSQQKQRGIIQGEYYIYVTPFLLAINLLREWWETYGDGIDFEEFVEKIPEKFRTDLLIRFNSRIPYINSVESGRQLVREFLSKEGIFSDGYFLQTEIGSLLFLKLTEANPKMALTCLMRTIGTWTKDRLSKFTVGRRAIITALEMIAIWRDLFADGARLLLALGEAENEEYANNASGVFVDLFSPGWGGLSPTEASPEERFPILLEAINSDSMIRKRLALKAFSKSLQTGHFFRIVGAEYQGAKAPPKLWTPNSRKEIFDVYRNSWNYLEENLETFYQEIRDEAVTVLLGAARGIAAINSSFSQMVRKTIRSLNEYSWVDRTKLMQTVSRIIHYDGKKMPDNDLKEWNVLNKALIGSSFSGELRRFVGLDLVSDYFQNTAKYNTKWVDANIEKLAKKAVEKPALMEPEFSWLITDQARRGHQFGYALGMADLKFSFLEKILNEQKKASSNGTLNFFGGFLKAVFTRETSLWEEKLDSLSSDKWSKELIPELTWRSGMTNRAAKRIILMAKNREIKIESLGIFKYGRTIQQLSEQVFLDLIDFLLNEESDSSKVIALDLFFYYYHKSTKVLNKDLTLNLLLHSKFWDRWNQGPGDMSVYYWKEITKMLTNQFPETENQLAEQMLKSFGNKQSILEGFNSQLYDILDEMLKRNPNELWSKITKYLGPPLDKRAFYLKQWLRGQKGLSGRPGIIELINPHLIWEWVEKAKETRAWYLATFVPPYLFSSEEKICVARELLVRYGDQEDVRESFSANYSTEGWTGSATDHFLQKKMELLEFRKTENNEWVIRWIEEYLEELEKSIVRSKIREERRS